MKEKNHNSVISFAKCFLDFNLQQINIFLSERDHEVLAHCDVPSSMVPHLLGEIACIEAKLLKSCFQSIYKKTEVKIKKFLSTATYLKMLLSSWLFSTSYYGLFYTEIRITFDPRNNISANWYSQKPTEFAIDYCKDF